MSRMRHEILIADPDLPWDGPFPYALLDEALRAVGHKGLDPDTTAEDVKDALFDLMSAGAPSQQIHTAWNELRLADQRVVVDFFLYRLSRSALDPDDETLWEADVPLRDLPIEPLLDVGIDVESLADVLRVDVGEPPPAAGAPVDLPPLDIGAIDVDVTPLCEALDA